MNNEDKKIRVLMIGPARDVHGGISGVVNGYFSCGLSERVDLKYIGTMREGSKLEKFIIALGAFFQFIFAVNRADIVHVHLASDASFMRKSIFIRYAHWCKKRIIIHQHGGSLEEWYSSISQSKKKWVAGTLGCADRILVIAPYLKKLVVEILKDGEEAFPENNICIFPDSVNCRDYDYNISDERTILFMGRLCKEKGITELINIMPDLVRKYPDIKLILCGIWEDIKLSSLIETLPENIEYLGWIEGNKKRDILSKASIFVMPSYFEGQSLAILDAMMSGCCVVASDVGGIPMMIKDRKNGILVKPKDQNDLRRGLEEAIDNTEQRHRMIANSRKIALEEYETNHKIEQLVDLYTDLSQT